MRVVWVVATFANSSRQFSSLALTWRNAVLKTSQEPVPSTRDASIYKSLGTSIVGPACSA